MTTALPPRQDGYDWPMDASQRLADAAHRRAQIDRERANKNRSEAESAQRQEAVYRAAAQLAAKHGVDFGKLDPATDEDFERKDAELRRERLARQAQIRMRAIPSIFHRAKLDRSVPEHHIAQRWLTGYRNGERRSLAILGSVGLGKTHLAAAVAIELATRDHIPVSFITEAGLIAALRGGDTEPDMQLYMLAPVLVLDDLGADRATPWSLSQLLRLAHHRSHNGLPTIITTNLNPDQIREHCGHDERLVQRLFGGAELITMAGECRRPMPKGF